VFTGIVTHRGHIVEIRATEGEGQRLLLRPEPVFERAGVGDSIACDGVCLTVAAHVEDALAFDVVPETLRRTTLGERRSGDVLNLEPSLRQGDELGGHMVQGHVEGVGHVRAVETRGEDVRMVIDVPAALFVGLIPKGSVAVDGVSLTIGEVLAGAFSVYLVPHTLAVTGLGSKTPGASVNVEPDVMGRWVEHHVRRILGKPETPTQ